MKTVAQLDSQGYYIGHALADESPLEPGVYLIPGGAVDSPAPSIPDGSRAKWDGGWVIEVIPVPEPEPEPEPALPQPPQFTSLEYLDLFTDAEQLAVATATMENASVKLWYDRMLAASFITLADPRTEAGLSALVTAGLITVTRKKKIIEAMQ